MASRYDDRNILDNNSDLYQNVFKKRGVRAITQYSTPVLSKIDPSTMSDLVVLDHVWKRGDHFYKLSAQYYGDPTYWWIISQFNYRPTEEGLAFGDVILIPTPLDQLLTLYSSGQNSGIISTGGY